MTDDEVTFDRTGFRRALRGTVLRSLSWSLALTPSCGSLDLRHGNSFPFPTLAVLQLSSESWLWTGVVPIVVAFIVLVLRRWPSRMSFMRTTAALPTP